MEEQLEIKDFDILGLITLKDVKGIEKYVTPVTNSQSMFQEYLSRSKEYYNVKTMTELSQQREELKGLIDARLSKKNFVILENMLNCSGKVYFRKMERFIKNRTVQNEEEMNLAKACLNEDVRNIITILSKSGLIRVTKSLKLPEGTENSEKRLIEMDNKAMLYVFCKSLDENMENIEILTPGYGSIYIGPFLNQMYGYNYTNLLKSKYIKETLPQTQETDLIDLLRSERIFKKGKKILLLDDNIGTGATMAEIQSNLKSANIKSIISGAVQYNWRNYFRVSIGEKKDIDRFEVTDFDLVTPFNYAGHKLYKHAIDLLHSSGSEYIEYLNSKSYRKDEYCDLEGAVRRALICASRTDLDLADGITISDDKEREQVPLLDKYKDGPKTIANPISKKIIGELINYVTNIDNLQVLKEETEKRLF